MTLRMFPSNVRIYGQGKSTKYSDAVVYIVKIDGQHMTYRVHGTGRVEVCDDYSGVFRDTVFPGGGDPFS